MALTNCLSHGIEIAMPALNELMELRPLSPPDDDELEITGSDPVLETKFRLAETAAAALASVGVAVNDLWELKQVNASLLRLIQEQQPRR